MKLQRILPLVAALVVGGAASLPLPATAQVGFSITIGDPPPPVRYEAVPPPRYGYIWVPGYWNWDGRRHVWVQGHWERGRSGYYYEAPRWVQRGDHWQLYRGGWHRGRGGDRDRDGIPNRYDRDRDGDGVRNDYDRRPNDPRRY